MTTLQDAAPDWRLVFEGAVAHFETGSWTTGVALVAAIGRVGEELGRPPSVDLRGGSVTVTTTSDDVEVALAVSAAARELGVSADPSRVQTVQLTIDALVPADVMPFWRAVLGYELTEEDVVDPLRRGPDIWFQDMDEPRTGRNRIHVDVSVPHDQAQARVEAGLAAGGRIVYDGRAPKWWTLADPEGNEVDIAAWPGQED